MATCASSGRSGRIGWALWITLFVVGFAVSCLGQQESSLLGLKARYEAKRRELDAIRDKSLADAPAKYRLYLQVLEKQFIDKGELESVVAIRAETNRFGATGVVTTNELVAQPPELRSAQLSFMEAPESVERARAKGRDDLNRYYFNALELLKVELTKKARIQEALDVAAEIDRIRPLVPPEPLMSSGSITSVPPVKAKAEEVPKPASPAIANPVAPVLPVGLKTGLISFYPLNAAADDISSNGHNGELTGAQPALDRHGVAGGAVTFDGVDDSIILDRRIAPSFFSVTMWVKAASDKSTGVLIQRGGNGFVIVKRSGKVEFAADVQSGTAARYSYSDDGILDGRWHHIAMTYGADGFCVFTDGTKRYSSRAHGTPPVLYSFDAASRFGIGAFPGGRAYLRGSIDDVGIWDRQLSAAEIRQVGSLSGLPVPR